MRSRSFFRFAVWKTLALATLALVAAAPAHATWLEQWTTSAHVQTTGNTVTTGFASPPTGPDETTGFRIADGANGSPPLSIESGVIATFELSSGVIATGSSYYGTNSLSQGVTRYEARGDSELIYLDDLAISSPTLPNGSPVTLLFVYELAHSVDVFALGSFVEGINTGLTLGRITSNLGTTQVLTEPDNRFRIDLDSPGLNSQTGLFGTQSRAEFMVATTVGATLDFALFLDCDVRGFVHPNPSGDGSGGFGAGECFAAVAYGADALASDAVITSDRLDAPFPSAALVDSAAAQAALPTNPLPVPEPAVALLATAALSTLGSLVRTRSADVRRRGSHVP